MSIGLFKSQEKGITLADHVLSGRHDQMCRKISDFVVLRATFLNTVHNSWPCVCMYIHTWSYEIKSRLLRMILIQSVAGNIGNIQNHCNGITSQCCTQFTLYRINS